MEVRDIVTRVSRHFYDLVDEDANPLVVALALQDNSSVGLQHHSGEFAELHDQLREALKARVDANYQGFNTSVGVYHSAVAALKSGNADIHDAREQLIDVHNQLAKRKPMLKDLQHKSALFKRKLEILADLEEIQSVPPRYEDCVARKQFREAQSLLSHALEKINSRDLLQQPAIQPIYTYLMTQQSQLYNRVLDEIRAHVYLTSPYAQRRIQPESEDYKTFMRRLPDLPKVRSDSHESPESNSFGYLVLLGETLLALHRLGDGIDELVKHASEDLHQLAQRITAGVVAELKLSPESLRKAAQSGGTIIEQFKAVNQTALSALASSLYTQLTAVLEGHRAMVEIAAQLGVRRSLYAVCAAVIFEARTLLLSYTGGDQGPVMRFRPRADSDTNSLSHISRSRPGGSLFEFGDGDEDSRGLRDFDALREALKRSVPGLLTDDPHHLFADTQEQQRMEVVAPAHILNIRPLLEPSVAFFARASSIAKDEAAQREFDSFLDTFLQKSFVPRLQRTFEHAIERICGDDNALSESSVWTSRSQLPLVESVVQFADTIGLLCQLLDMGSSFREDYAVILVGLVSKMIRFLESRTTALFGNERRPGKMWTLASSPQLSKMLSGRYARIPEQTAEFAEYFAQRLSQGTSKPSLTLGDLLDVATYTQASLLVTSMRWLALVLRRMRRAASSDASRHEKSSAAVRRRWMLLDAPVIKEGVVALQHTHAVLAGKQLSQYDADIALLDRLALKSLSALRTDVFCRIVYYFDQMVIGRDFQSGRRREERDPVVDSLQRELSHIAQVGDANLIAADREFLIAGIAQFMNELFILEGENIREMSESGQSQMLTNVFALQQMLTSVVSDPRDVDFSRATSFYELFRLGPSIIVERVRIGETDMNIDDLKLLLAIRHRKVGSSAAGTLSDHYAAIDEIFKSQDSEAQVKQPPVMPLRTRKSNASMPGAAATHQQRKSHTEVAGRAVAREGQEQHNGKVAEAEARRLEEKQKQEAARRDAEAKYLQNQRRERKAQMEAEARKRDENRLQRAHEDAENREAERLASERLEKERLESERRKAEARERQRAEAEAAEAEAAQARARQEAERREAEARAARERQEAERRAAEQRTREVREKETQDRRLAEERAAAAHVQQRQAQERQTQERQAQEARDEERDRSLRAQRNRAMREERENEQAAAEQHVREQTMRSEMQAHEQAQAQAQARSNGAPTATTAAAPAPEAARSPLLHHTHTHRVHNESKQPQPEQTEQAEQLPHPPLPPLHQQRSRSPARPQGPRGSPQSAQRPPQSPEVLPRVRNRPSGLSLRAVNAPSASPNQSPVTPTSPSDESRQRTASERALEAAQRVRQRSLPQPTIRRTK